MKISIGTLVMYLLGALLLFGIVSVGFTPGGRAKWNTYWNKMQKVDDATLYRTRKQVEDNCRAMMASYNADLQTYKQFKDATGEERSWGQQAKMRANRTAASYNEFVLKNSYVWADNIPLDIKITLPNIE